MVCEDAARRTAQGEQVMCTWRPGELKAHVSNLLMVKDGKTFQGGPYAEIVASLFTDEPTLTLEQAKSELAGTSFGPYKQLTSAFLLLLRPRYEDPVVSLKVSR